MNPLDLLAAAKLLLTAQRRGALRQDFVKRAVSTAYYALFHCICTNCADCLIGTKQRNTRAWRLIYRAVEHGFARRQCLRRDVIATFSKNIQLCAEIFVLLQTDRQDADYNPFRRFFSSEALVCIESAGVAIESLQTASMSERTEFAAWLLHKERQ